MSNNFLIREKANTEIQHFYISYNHIMEYDLYGEHQLPFVILINNINANW